MATQERNLDSYFELLKQNRLDENTSIDGVERIVNFYEKLFSLNLSSETVNSREVLQNTIKRFKEGIIWVRFNCNRLNYFLQVLEAEGTDFAKFINGLVELLSECESLTIRALNRFPAENELMLSPELNDKILSVIVALEKVAKIIHETCISSATQLSSVHSDGFSSVQMNEMLHSSVEKLYGSTNSSKVYSILSDNIDILKGFLLEISERLENSSIEIPPIQKNVNIYFNFQLFFKTFPPILERAHKRKSDAVEAEGLKWQISQKEEEVLKLQRLVKSKENDISTAKLRIELAEKQIQQSGKNDDAHTQQLQLQYDQLSQDFLKLKEEYEKEVEALQQKIDKYEKDIKKDKEAKDLYSKKAMFSNVFVSGNMSPITPTTPAMSLDYPQDNGYLEKEYNTTLNDLKWAEQRIRILENENSKKLLDSLAPIHCTSSVCGPYSMYYRDDNNNDDVELQRMLKESESLIAESNRYLIEPLDPKEKLIHRERVASINDKIESLKYRFHRFWNRTHPGMDYPQLLSF